MKRCNADGHLRSMPGDSSVLLTKINKKIKKIKKTIKKYWAEFNSNEAQDMRLYQEIEESENILKKLLFKKKNLKK